MKTNDAWNPYVAGGLSGLLGVLSVLLVGQFFGASTSFVRTAGMIEQVFGPERVAEMDYFIQVVPEIDWQWMFVFGIMLGSLVSSLTSGTFRWQPVPDMWAQSFGHTPVKRAVLAFCGGILVMFGARLADG